MSEKELKRVFSLTIVKHILKYFNKKELDKMREVSKMFNVSIWKYYLHNYYFTSSQPGWIKYIMNIRKISCSDNDYLKFSHVQYLRLELETKHNKRRLNLDFSSMNLISLTIIGRMDQSLGFRDSPSGEVRSILPPSLKYLCIDRVYGDISSPSGKSYLPDGILHVYIDIPKNIDNFPDSIEVLYLGTYFNQEITKYPENLRHLSFGTNFNQDVINLPKKLISLNIPNQEHKKRVCLNDGLKLLYYTSNVIHNLPMNLEFYVPPLWISNETYIQLREKNENVEIFNPSKMNYVDSLYKSIDMFYERVHRYVNKYEF